LQRHVNGSPRELGITSFGAGDKVEFGTMINIANGLSGGNTPQSTAWSPSSVRRSDKVPDDDSAVAVIRNLHRVENTGSEQGAVDGKSAVTGRERIQQFTASLNDKISRRRELAGEITDGRFSPRRLREQIEKMEESIGSSGALAWLRNNARSALMSQQGIEPGRVLALLREMINPDAATS
jgi:hypothetical protein